MKGLLNRKDGFIGKLFLGGIIVFVLHYGLNYALGSLVLWESLSVGLIPIHGFLLLTSLVMTLSIVYAHQLSPKNLGFSFLGILTVKLLGVFLFVSPLIEEGGEGSFLKINLLGLIFAYILYDVYVAFRLLNEKK